MASKSPTPLNKEDEIGRKWDRCLTDFLLKLGVRKKKVFVNTKNRPTETEKGEGQEDPVFNSQKSYCFLLVSGGGLIIGGVVSYIFCNRKKWPMALASGFAVGMAYCNCERDLNLAVAPACNPTPKNKQ